MPLLFFASLKTIAGLKQPFRKAGFKGPLLPVAFFYVRGFFRFSPFFYLIAGVSDDSVKHAASHILALGITIIGKLQHGFDKSKCSFNIFVGWFQYLKSTISTLAYFYLTLTRILVNAFFLFQFFRD
jgi:hypothetical protein